MAIEAVVSVVIQKFTDLVMQDSNTFEKVKDEVQDLIDDNVNRDATLLKSCKSTVSRRKY